MKKWRKLLSLMFVAVMVLSINVTAFAAEPAVKAHQAETLIQEVESTNVFDVLTKDNELSRATWIGNAGSSTLDYMSSARAFAWTINVTPTSVLPLTFAGQIDVYTTSTGAYKGSLYISGAGAGKASGVVYVDSLSLRSGTNYTAKYSGTATNTAGQVFKVVEGASISFTYTR